MMGVVRGECCRAGVMPKQAVAMSPGPGGQDHLPVAHACLTPRQVSRWVRSETGLA
jgi:hypothetical protein